MNNPESSQKEYERLLFSARKNNDDRLYYLIQTMGSTGIRVSDVKFITMEAVLKGVATISCNGKIREVLIPKKLCQMLKKYAKSEKIYSGSISITKNKKLLNRTNIWKIW